MPPFGAPLGFDDPRLDMAGGASSDQHVAAGLACLERHDSAGALKELRAAGPAALNSAPVQYAIAVAHIQQGDLAAATSALRQVIALDPGFARAHFNLGVAAAQAGDAAEAEAAWRRAISADPSYRLSWSALEQLLARQGRQSEADTVFRDALSSPALAPADKAELWVLRGDVTGVGNPDAAVAAYENAVALAPQAARPHAKLGKALSESDRQAAADLHFARAAELDPATALLSGCGLIGLLYAGADPAIHLKFAHAAMSNMLPARFAPHPNRPDPDRRLRIGYVSPDFRNAVVAHFVEPILAAHDQAAFEVFCYAEVARPDAMTERCRRSVSVPTSAHWRDTVGMPDEVLAAQIRADGIDILIDLAGHTTGSRLSAFAAKPAPIQMTGIGYPATTGLTAIDWRLTDAIADPPGLTEPQYSERLLRLTPGFNCYQPPDAAPAVAPLPADTTGYITFGSFNNVAKIRDHTLDAWAELLRRVPGSRLVLKHLGFGFPLIRDEYINALRRRGLPDERFEVMQPIHSLAGHLGAYGRIDIALDTFPYSGTTTTCEALWMGVPVVTLAGTAHHARVGASLLTRLGLADLIADTVPRYVEIAAALAAYRPRLAALRGELRPRMAASSLCDAKSFTRHFEAALREIWRAWCRSQHP